jgi:hypothetical protein
MATIVLTGEEGSRHCDRTKYVNVRAGVTMFIQMEPLSQNLKKKQVLLEVAAFLQPSRPKTALHSSYLTKKEREKKKEEKKKEKKPQLERSASIPFNFIERLRCLQHRTL